MSTLIIPGQHNQAVRVSAVAEQHREPFLENWVMAQAVRLGFAQDWHEYDPFGDVLEFLDQKRVKSWLKLADARRQEAAEVGTELHTTFAGLNNLAQQQREITGNFGDTTYGRIGAAWWGFLRENVTEIVAIERRLFGVTNGYNYTGQIDLLCVLKAGTKLGHGGRILEHNALALIDFKATRAYYTRMCIQLAGYRELIRQNMEMLPDVCLTVRVDVDNAGAGGKIIHIKEWGQMEWAWTYFSHLLGLWYAKQNANSVEPQSTV